MINRIECLHFRCMKHIDQKLGRFQALVGPNASGKTTFLEVLTLLRDLMRSRGDVLETVRHRSSDFQKLVWMGQGSSFQIAVEAAIPPSLIEARDDTPSNKDTLRYEIEIGLDTNTNEIGLDAESLLFIKSRQPEVAVRQVYFPSLRREVASILLPGKLSKGDLVLRKKKRGNDNFYVETGKSKYNPSFQLGRTRSALANLPGDSTRFPVGLWFRDLLEKGVQSIILNSQTIRQPSPPGLGTQFLPDGSNLPWVIHELTKDRERFDQWVDHVRTALVDISTIRTVEREEDRHRYLVIEYATGASVPSWLVSDGTLRLLALTILAYVKDAKGIYLIEEPENGIHPRAMETVLQSLESIYRGQVLIATHSPVVLSQLEPSQILCFAKDDEGATDIVLGSLHPRLQEWKHSEVSLGNLFASGILG